jgi:polysaccharide biosynthesis transport protein
MFQDAVPNAIQTVDLAAKSGPGDRPGTLMAWTELPEMLFRRAGWIVSGVLIALVAALLFISVMPPAYTASTEVVVQPTDLKAVDGAVTQTSNQPDTSVALVETAARVLTSSKVLERVVEKLGLASDPEFTHPPSRLKGLVAEVRKALHVDAQAPADDPLQDALKQLSKQIAVRRSERTFVIDVAVKSNDPLKAAQVANAIVDSFLEVQASARADASRRISDALTSRLSELRDSVRRNEDAVQRFKVAHNLVVANGQLVNEQQLSEVSNQLLAAENRTADAKAKLDQVEAAAQGRDPGAIPESLQSQTIGSLRSQLAQVSKQEADARVIFGARHPQIAQMRSQVEAVRRALDGEVQRIREAARIEYDRSRASEAALRANLARQQTKGTEANAAQIRLRELERDAEASRSVYEAFLVRARETAEQERVDTLNAWVASPATPPTERSFPPPNLTVFGAALVLGLLFGAGAGLLRERLDPRLWTSGRVEAVTGVPVLATIDALRGRPAMRDKERAGPAFEAGYGTDGLLALVQDLTGGRAATLGRVVFLLGARDEHTGVAAGWLAAVAAAEGHRTTLVRLVGAAPKASPSGAAAGEPVEFVDPTEPWQVPVLIERLKGCLADLTEGGLLIVAGRHTSLAIPQLVGFADAALVVLARARSTRAQARAVAQRLKGRAGVLRGAILIRRAS